MKEIYKNQMKLNVQVSANGFSPSNSRLQVVPTLYIEESLIFQIIWFRHECISCELFSLLAVSLTFYSLRVNIEFTSNKNCIVNILCRRNAEGNT